MPSKNSRFNGILSCLSTSDLALLEPYLSAVDLPLRVRRPGVTVALHLLERAGLIARSRGAITILDRDDLRESSNGADGAQEAQLQRLSA